MKSNQLTLDNFDGSEDGLLCIRGALGLGDRWVVTGVYMKRGNDVYPVNDENPDCPFIFADSPKELEDLDYGTATIHIESRRKCGYLCPCCGSSCKVHQYERRPLRHVSFLNMECYLDVKVPKLHCEKCGKYVQLPFPLADPRVSYTKTFASAVLTRLYRDTVTATARALKVGRHVVSEILHKYISKMMENLDLSNVSKIYIDEIQFGHGQNYITVVSDQTKRVVFMCKDHDADTLRQFKEWLIGHGGDPNDIVAVSADMSRAYESGVTEHFPNADIIFDRFHMVKSVNEAVDKVRKRTMRKLSDEDKSAVGKAKYTVLYRERNHNEKHEERMMNIRIFNPELALAFDMKEGFCDILESKTKSQAKMKFEEWYHNVILYGAKEMKAKAEMFRSKLERILCWYDHKISNGFAEGLNARLQKAKSAAFGFRKIENFIGLCFFRFGNLPVSI